MTTIENTNSSIEMYLRSSTIRYLELGGYETSSQMLDILEYEFIDNFIEYELIFKIGYCWTYNIHDIGKWRNDPMFSLMYRHIINNPTLMSYMNDFITRGRNDIGRAAYTGEYAPVDVLRNYTFYYAKTLDKNFFRQIIEEHFRQDTCDEPLFTRRRRHYESSDDSDDDDSDDEIPELDDTPPTRIPPPA